MATNLTEKPVLVTGGTGWLASHIVYQLLDRGYKVRATVRDINSPKTTFLKGSDFHPRSNENLSLFEADLEKADGWDAAVNGCDYVIHVASPFKFKYKDQDKELVQPAVHGVQYVFKACFGSTSTVKRIVLTSSVCSVVYGHPAERYACNKMVMDMARKIFNDKCWEMCTEQDLKENAKTNTNEGELEEVPTRTTDVPLDNSDPYSEMRTSCPVPAEWGNWKLLNQSDWSKPENIKGYELSKVLAEKEAWALLKEHNVSCPDRQIELVTLCPGYIFGPILCEAHKSAESSVHILRLLQRTYPVVPAINSAHVDVRDAAMCHILALECPKAANKRYIVTADDGNLDFAEQATLLDSSVGVYGFNVPKMKAPKFITAIGALFSSSIATAASKVNDITYTTNEATHTELGMTKWRTTKGALYAHAITLAKFGALPNHKIPTEVIDGFKAY